MIDVEAKIRRIRSLAGRPFTTMSGLPFTFSVSGETLRTSRTDYALSLGDFRKALALVPLDGPGEITSYLANRVVLETLNGMAERQAGV